MSAGLNEREYNIILHKGVDYGEFFNSLVDITNKDGIPNRKVTIANPRNGSYRQTHFYLTEVEKKQLLKHPSVLDIEIPPSKRTDIIKSIDAIQNSNFTRDPQLNAQSNNWGLVRSSYKDNPYGGNNETGLKYNYTLDGTGVDIVITDSGIQSNHPEFQDKDGNSRVQDVNWASLSGLSFTQHINHNRDQHGHGTHVAGTAAGKNFGWARNAKIYSLKISGLEASSDTGTGIDDDYAFDAIKLWHRSKPIDPNTGYKRPTVVNMSWGYVREFEAGGNLHITHRGLAYPSASLSQAKSKGLNSFSTSQKWRIPYRVTSVDVDIQELIEEGVIVVAAAGNSNLKQTDISNIDYNNGVTVDGSSTYYYNRGSSPFHSTDITVGAIDEAQYNNDGTYIDQKASYSDNGPLVDIYAPGSGIISAVTDDLIYAKDDYQYDDNFMEAILSGTSMASPQVAGIAALYLQSSPGMTPAKLKSVILANSSTQVHNPSESPSGSFSFNVNTPKLVFNKYGNSNPLEYKGDFTTTSNISF
jgi:subtilisin family serine protease